MQVVWGTHGWTDLLEPVRLHLEVSDVLAAERDSYSGKFGASDREAFMQPVVGTDAGVFEIQPTLAGYSLFIRVGTALDGTTRPALSGAALASTVTLSAPTLPVEFTRNVAGEEPPPPPADGSVTLTGSVRYAGADKAIPGTIVWLTKPGDTSGESALVGSSVRDAVTFSFTAENG